MTQGGMVPINIDGKPLLAKRIGAGGYATAYRTGNTVYLLVDPDDRAREVLWRCWTRTNSPHLPRLTRHRTILDEDDQPLRVYSMPYYHRVRRGTIAYHQAERLAEAWWAMWPLRGVSGMRRLLAAVPDLPASLRRAIRALGRTAAHLYGDHFSWEFPLKNFSVDEAGTLILRDYLY